MALTMRFTSPIYHISHQAISMQRTTERGRRTVTQADLVTSQEI